MLLSKATLEMWELVCRLANHDNIDGNSSKAYNLLYGKKAEKKDLLCSILKPACSFSPHVGRVDWLTQYCNLNAMEAVMP